MGAYRFATLIATQLKGNNNALIFVKADNYKVCLRLSKTISLSFYIRADESTHTQYEFPDDVAEGADDSNQSDLQEFYDTGLPAESDQAAVSAANDNDGAAGVMDGEKAGTHTEFSEVGNSDANVAATDPLALENDDKSSLPVKTESLKTESFDMSPLDTSLNDSDCIITSEYYVETAGADIHHNTESDTN